MGMYTKFEFEGTVKPQYRPIIQALYDTDLDFKESVHKLKMVPFYDLAESERGKMKQSLMKALVSGTWNVKLKITRKTENLKSHPNFLRTLFHLSLKTA